MKRVVASLMERYQGRLPLWLAPVQAVLPVGEAQDPAADEAVRALRRLGLRVEVRREGSLGSRIREARAVRASVVVVMGEREAAQGMAQATDGRDSSKHILDHRRPRPAHGAGRRGSRRPRMVTTGPFRLGDMVGR